MQRFDFGHLEILEVLLEEQSISKAALRLNISPSALSRTLAKMREAVGDQILAPSGRVLRLTKRGLELRDQIKSLNDQARALLEPRKSFNPSNVIRNFKIRASDSSTLLIGSPLLQEVRKITPGVTLSFVTEGKADIESLRKGAIDFDIGSIAEPHPELVSQSLYSDEFVCIASQKEKLSGKQISMRDFCSLPHVVTSRKAKTSAIIDQHLAKIGKSRKVIASVSSFQEALTMVSYGGVLTQAPQRLAMLVRAQLGLEIFILPVETPRLEIVLTWHIRNKEDREHEWLREIIQKVARPTFTR